MGGSSNIAEACYGMLWPSNGDFPSVVHDMCMTLNYLHKDQEHHEVQSYCYCPALLDCQAHEVMHARLYTKASWQEAGNLMISTVAWLRRSLRASRLSIP